MKKRNVLFVLALCVLAVCLLTGCGKKEVPEEPEVVTYTSPLTGVEREKKYPQNKKRGISSLFYFIQLLKSRF